MSLEDIICQILDRTSNYKEKALKDKALELIPVSKIWSNTCALFRETQLHSNKFTFEESVLLEKLFLENFISWFKNEFFKWYEPNCSRCSKHCEMVGYNSISPGRSIGSTEVNKIFCSSYQFYFHYWSI